MTKSAAQLRFPATRSADTHQNFPVAVHPTPGSHPPQEPKKLKYEFEVEVWELEMEKT
jgi:hypothetical protein